ncbi:MAG: hypothetical protein KGS45_11315 [Planctomycetes bacterium]|nr:hypothetical protein [Planctomycetota bacterium]
MFQQREWSGLDTGLCTLGMRINGIYDNAAGNSVNSTYTNFDTSGRATIDGCSQLDFYTGTPNGGNPEDYWFDNDSFVISTNGGGSSSVPISSPTALYAANDRTNSTTVTLNRNVRRVVLLTNPVSPDDCTGNPLTGAAITISASKNASSPSGAQAEASVTVTLEKNTGSGWTTVLTSGASCTATIADTSVTDSVPQVTETNPSLLTSGVYRITVTTETYAGGKGTTANSLYNPSSPGLAPILFIECPADYNRDGVVDFFDYLDFSADFDAEDCKSDFNFDRSIDFFDYLDFTDAFDAGCD